MSARSRRAGLGTAALVCLACLVPEHSQAGTRSPAPRRATPPERECQPDPAMPGAAGPGDLEISADGTWFECVCELHVYTEPDCMWYEITSPAREPDRLRKLPAKAKHTRLLARRVIILAVRT